MVRYVPLTKGKYASVDDDDYDSIMRYRWKYSNRGYANRNYYIDGKYKTEMMYRLIMGEPEGKFVDHIDGNPLNNQKSNLRIVSNGQNSRNQVLGERNKSGYKGVHWKDNKWVSVITLKGRKYHLGYFDDVKEAARMYNFWAVDLHGEYARLNEIDSFKPEVVTQG